MRLIRTALPGILLLVGIALNGFSNDAPFATKVVSMEYPRLAALAQITGTVVLRVRIDRTGGVLGASGLSGHPVLTKGALANIAQWKFSAGRSSGDKSESEFDFTYVFELRGETESSRPCSSLTYEYPNKVTIVSEAPLCMP